MAADDRQEDEAATEGIRRRGHTAVTAIARLVETGAVGIDRATEEERGHRQGRTARGMRIRGRSLAEEVTNGGKEGGVPLYDYTMSCLLLSRCSSSVQHLFASQSSPAIFHRAKARLRTSTEIRFSAHFAVEWTAELYAGRTLVSCSFSTPPRKSATALPFPTVGASKASSSRWLLSLLLLSSLSSHV